MVPLSHPLRVARTRRSSLLSNGRVALGLGSGYRKYEFDSFGFPKPSNPSPKICDQEIAQLAFQMLRNPGRAFPFQIPDHLRHLIFRRNRYQHVHVVGRQVSHLDLAFHVDPAAVRH